MSGVYQMPQNVSVDVGLGLALSCRRILVDIALLDRGDENEAFAIWQALVSMEQQVQACVNAAAAKVSELNARRES